MQPSGVIFFTKISVIRASAIFYYHTFNNSKRVLVLISNTKQEIRNLYFVTYNQQVRNNHTLLIALDLVQI